MEQDLEAISTSGTTTGDDHSGGEGAPATTRCPHCGALNKVNAQWCGQCLTPFAKPESSQPPPPDPVDEFHALYEVEDQAEVARPATPKPVADLERGAFKVEGGEISWACPRCDTRNDLADHSCSVCGATFGEMVNPRKPQAAPRDPGTAAMVSLFLPGAGHGYLGMWGQAVARVVLSIWVVAVALITAAQQGAASPTPLMFGAVATGLWLVAAHDAYRVASGDPGSALLKERHFLYVVLGILLLSILSVFAAALGASR